MPLFIALMALISTFMLSMPLCVAKPIEWQGIINLGNEEKPNFIGIIVHHTASTHMSLEECNDWHKSRGWNECGYNFIIQPNGNLNIARGYDKIGAHSKGNNNFLGVAFVGNGRATDAQLVQFKTTFKRFSRVLGHNQLSETACPGEIMNQIRSMK